jgi:vancomycin resistance protein VanJ
MSAPVWGIVLGLLLIAVAHVVAFDRDRIFMLADSYTLWIYLPAYLIVVSAVLFRARALALVAGLLVVAHLVWVVPPMLRSVTVPAAAARAPQVRVVSANLNFDNGNHAPLLTELTAANADVIFLQEVTPAWWEAIERSGLLATHPRHVEVPRDDPGGLAILSREPLDNVVVHDADGWPIITADVIVAGTLVHVADVHLVAPLDTFARNQRQQRAISAIVRQLPQPRAIVGDFNASPYNRWYQDLRGLGLREAHEADGRSFATTWPNGLHHFPPLRLDHVFVDPPIVPLRTAEGTGTGSDHRPITVDLAIVPA